MRCGGNLLSNPPLSKLKRVGYSPPQLHIQLVQHKASMWEVVRRNFLGEAMLETMQHNRQPITKKERNGGVNTKLADKKTSFAEIASPRLKDSRRSKIKPIETIQMPLSTPQGAGQEGWAPALPCAWPLLGKEPRLGGAPAAQRRPHLRLRKQPGPQWSVDCRGCRFFCPRPPVRIGFLLESTSNGQCRVASRAQG